VGGREKRGLGAEGVLYVVVVVGGVWWCRLVVVVVWGVCEGLGVRAAAGGTLTVLVLLVGAFVIVVGESVRVNPQKSHCRCAASCT
jgi:hypothetical protein